jgi:branched-chain amino acid transport system ATP-binding protein
MSLEPDARGFDLATREVTLHFGGVAALTDVEFSVESESVVGIIGPNGSGKTSLLNCISGAYRPQRGRIEIDGKDVTRLSPHQVAALGVSRTFQHVEIPRDVTVLELAMFGRHRLMNRFGLVAYGLGLPWLTGYEREHQQAAYRALELVGIDGLANERIGDLPYGLAKRADLARALAGEPRLLLLDEPAAGLDASERGALADLVAGVAERRLTVVLVEHDMRFVSRVCHRLVVMAGGTPVFQGSPDEAAHDDQVMHSFLGQADVTLGSSGGQAQGRG